jgi:8-hydroxy-5-deazaflavin:NADPH oxidoreductase
MKIAIIGLGNMGKGLASRLAGKVELVVASRDQAKATSFVSEHPNANVKTMNIRSAVLHADIVVLALPYDIALDTARSTPELSGKIVVDMSNPISSDFSGLTLGYSTSAAEEIQKNAKGAKVIKAFHTIFAQLFAYAPAATRNVSVFVAGNDEAAVEAVATLAATAGFTSNKAGGLDAARLLEPVGMLNIRFGYGIGRGTAIAPGWTTVSA